MRRSTSSTASCRYHVGETVLTAVTGSLPSRRWGLPHTFTVDIEPSRVLVITGPAGFSVSFELGVLATSDEPPAGLARPAAVILPSTAERHGIEIVGPATATWRKILPHDVPHRHPQDVQALCRRTVPALGVGTLILVRAPDGTPLANAVRSSRKDVRDAVRLARGAAGGWAAKTAMNRGQVLYRVAELMEGRRAQFVEEVAAAEGVPISTAEALVDRSIDRWVWYAGWADKITQVIGTVNPVGAPYFNFTIPEATGIVGIVAPEASSLLGLVSRWRRPSSGQRRRPPHIGDAAAPRRHADRGPRHVRRARWRRQRPDRLRKELVPVLAAHVDVDALDTWGVPDELRLDTELTAADDIKRILRRPTTVSEARFDWLDDRAAERPEWIAAFLEMKTVWHPIGV